MLLSVSIILLHVFIIYLVRKQLKQRLKTGSLHDLILDGLFAFELGCLAQEQGVILQYYGLVPWACCLFCVVVWQVVYWEGLSSSPIPHLLKFNTLGLARTLVMLICSLVSFRYMSKIWEFELTELHQGRGRVLSVEKCAYPFQQKSYSHLVVTEFVGCMSLTLISAKLFENVTLVNNDPTRFIRGAIMGGLVVFTVVLGMDVSGAMYNPTLATLLLGGCSGQTPLEHLLVYWISPTAGAWVGESLHKMAAKPNQAKMAAKPSQAEKKLKAN